MGWNITIKTDKPMTNRVIKNVIVDLPDSMQCGPGKQTWGWSLAVDVSHDKPNELRLSGSFGMSGRIAEGVAEAFARRLEKRKYRVSVSKLT